MGILYSTLRRHCRGALSWHFGAVLVQGPKWCGKTTTARRFAASTLSLTVSSGGFAARRMAELDPSQAISGEPPRLIDEWQEVPDVSDAVRYECDVASPASSFSTGSATPRDDLAPMHSGVGRFARVAWIRCLLRSLGYRLARSRSNRFSPETSVSRELEE